MKKEKQIKTYQRRTKSGKTVTVKAHTAKYDAAEKAKEAAKKKGAGKELEELKKKSPQLELDFDKAEENNFYREMQQRSKEAYENLTKTLGKNAPKEKKSTKKSKDEKYKKTEPKKSVDEVKTEKKVKEKPTPKHKEAKASTEPTFTTAEFKEWYRGTGSAADKKVAKILKTQLGRSGYRKLEDEAIDNYSSRGHLKMFKSLGNMGEDVKSKPKDSTTKNGTKVSSSKTSVTAEKPKTTSKQVKRKIPDNFARNVARDEDFATITEAKRYLQSLPDDSYESYRKAYGGPSDPSMILSGIIRGSRGIVGSDATRAKKFLRESSDYTKVKTSKGTLYIKKGGRSGYLAAPEGLGPSQLRIATASEVKSLTGTTKAQKTTSKKSKALLRRDAKSDKTKRLRKR